MQFGSPPCILLLVDWIYIGTDNCERVSGDGCFVARAHVDDVAEMEAVIDRLVPFGATNSSVVQSAPVPERLVEL